MQYITLCYLFFIVFLDLPMEKVIFCVIYPFPHSYNYFCYNKTLLYTTREIRKNSSLILVNFKPWVSTDADWGYELNALL
jgi:hypothetical protein